MRLKTFFEAQANWAEKEEPSDKVHPVAKLLEAAERANYNPESKQTLVQCIFWSLDAARRSGATYKQIKFALFEYLMSLRKLKKTEQP